MPPVIYTGHITGDTLPAADWNGNWSLVESGALDLGAFVISGLVPTIGTGLSVNVSSGTALIGAHLAPAGFSIVGLTDNTTNHLYLNQAGTGTSNTTGTQPAATAKLGTCVTAAGVVTSVNTNRSSGRQAYVRPELQVPGGPGAGNLPSINLANWAAAAGDSVPVFGVLPQAAIGGAPMTAPPLAASLTPVNVTTATLADSAVGLFLNAANISNSHGQFWVKTLAAGAYTWIVRLDLMLTSTTFTAGGLALRDSAGGKLITFEQNVFGDTALTVEQWTDANTRSAIAFTTSTVGQVFRWLKIHDDAANRTYSISQDGVNWLDMWTEARTVFLGVAPNQAGIFACANGGPTGVTVYSWAGV